MALKQPSTSMSPLLGASLALNLSVLLVWASRIYYSSNSAGTEELASAESWTRVAALEAERAESFNCSRRGSVYTDMLFRGSPDTVACDCEECFTGLHCEHIIPDCQANVEAGDPLFFLPYWRQKPAASAVLIPGWYRIGYELSQMLIPGLEKEIRAIHELVGNAITEGRYIVVGAGEMQLMMAAYTTVSWAAQGLPVHTVNAPPYYDAYERQVKMVKPGTVSWEKPPSATESDTDWVPLEIVISPNNPDGSIRTGVSEHPATWTIYDHAYYWPHYTPITRALDEDIMLFTLSKVTGHAGSRIGWAIIKDKAVYEKMLVSVRLNSVGVSHEAQLRAAQLLRSTMEGYSKVKSVGLRWLPTEYASQQLLFHYGHAKLQSRWKRLGGLFQESGRFLIDQDIEPKYCNFLKELVRPGPAFAWIRCKREEDKSCVSVFEEAGIFGRGGARCGMTDQHVRLAMMSADFAFENLLTRIQALLSKQP